MPFFGVGNMFNPFISLKKHFIFVVFSLFCLSCLPNKSLAFDYSNVRFACQFNPSGDYKDPYCLKNGYVYTTAEEAMYDWLAERFKENLNSAGNGSAYEFELLGKCEGNPLDTTFKCNYRYRSRYVSRWQYEAWSDWSTTFGFASSDTLPLPDPFVLLKGSVAGIIQDPESGKIYSLSRAIYTDTNSQTSCVYGYTYVYPRSSGCYFVSGSVTDSFCNFEFSLYKDVHTQAVQRCYTATQPVFSEIGDPLTKPNPECDPVTKENCEPVPECDPITKENCEPDPDESGGSTGGGSTGGGSTGGGSTGGGSTGGGSTGGGSTGGGSTGGGSTGGGSTGGGSDGGNDGGTGGTGGGGDTGVVGGDNGSTGSGDGGNGGTGGGTGGEGEGGSGTGGGTGGTGGDDKGDESFSPPGPLDLSASVAGRGEQAKSQIMDMKQKMVSSNTFTTAKSAFSGSSHSAAVCPIGYVSLFAQEIVFDSHCKLFDLIAPILKAVFIAIWSFLAVRIVLTA